jgi:soluble lytic murein transglycosylase-like protein
VNDAGGAFSGPAEVAAIENRIAALSGDGPRDVAAFQALLGALPAGGFAAPAPANDSAPQPPAWIERLIAGASAATGDDPALIKAVVANESGFDPAATSPVGARGLMQLMPGTAADLGVSDAYDPAQNIAGGARYLAQLLQRFGGDVPLALAAYNAGPEAGARGAIPPETQNYVRSVLASYARYRADEAAERGRKGTD